MVAAGLLAKRAVELGLSVPADVKTSLAPGSKAVTEYLREAGLLAPLADLGFHLVGYGCTTCIGNSGPLPEAVDAAIVSGDLVVASVLSGNRNFEGRIHPHVKANYLASPPLVVAYALAGTVDINLAEEPLGVGADGEEVFLRDLWPSTSEVQETIARVLRPETYLRMYGNVWNGNRSWNEIPVDRSEIYPWDDHCTYIQEPPFFEGMTVEPEAPHDLNGLRVLVRCGDSVTTDHISPAGAIAFDSPAGEWLRERGIAQADFNSYGSRRGNDRVMIRGHVRQHPLPQPARSRNRRGFHGSPSHRRPDDDLRGFPALPRGRHAARGAGGEALRHRVLPGLGGEGHAAARGEGGDRRELRAHPSEHLVGMGVLPLEFPEGESADSLGLRGDEVFDIEGVGNGLAPRVQLRVTATGAAGSRSFEARCRLDSPVEVDYYRNGGILQTVMRRLARDDEEDAAA